MEGILASLNIGMRILALLNHPVTSNIIFGELLVKESLRGTSALGLVGLAT
jgi:hypothetical protein